METKNKTALVIGATGLVGSQLIDLLLQDEHFEKVTVFTRRSLENDHPKLTEHIIDFNQSHTWQHWVQGDILFSTLGTTLKQAGSKEAQYKIDYNYQLDFAKAAADQGVATYVLVSSASASPDSKIFYSRMKGELERDIKSLPFQSISILQPSLLYGDRNENRFGERISYIVLKGLNSLSLLKKYRPISGRTVARAMLNSGVAAEHGQKTYTLDKIFPLAEQSHISP